MFKPNAKIKKLLKTARCAYIYRDGVVIYEEKSVRIGKYDTSIDVYHVIPCEISILSNDYNKSHYSDCERVNRIVCHNPKMLIGGLESVSVAFGNSSEKSRQMGISATTITFTGRDGLEFRINSLSFLGCDLTIQPNPYDTYTSWNAPDSIKVCEDEKCVEYYECN